MRTLFRRLLVASVILAIAAGVLAGELAAWWRTREAVIAMERLAMAAVNDVTRDACTADPQWFLAGARPMRPRLEERSLPDADVRLPRPATDALPVEWFAYDDEFAATSTAGPRFPEAFRRAMRASPPSRLTSGPFASARGQGAQAAIATGWGGPCAVLLFRAEPAAPAWIAWLASAALVAFLAFAVSLGAGLPIARRVRALAEAARASVKQGYAGVAPVSGSDEVASLGAVFNDAAGDIRTRMTEAQDREEVIRRQAEIVAEDVAVPLAALAGTFAQAATGGPAAANPAVVFADALRHTHALTSRLQNIVAAARLRTVTAETAIDRVDVSAVVSRVVAARHTLARVVGVQLETSGVDAGVALAADEALVERAVAVLVDNAILHCRKGDRVRVGLRGFERGTRLSLTVSDTGPGVDDAVFAALTANRRFRGDESRARRPDGRGLGLAVAREVADRFGLKLDLRRPASGGFEAEIATR